MSREKYAMLVGRDALPLGRDVMPIPGYDMLVLGYDMLVLGVVQLVLSHALFFKGYKTRMPGLAGQGKMQRGPVPV